MESGTPPPVGIWGQIRAMLDLLMDFSFQKFVTPRLVKTLYALSLLAAVLSALAWMFSGFAGGNVLYGLFTLVTGPVAFLVYMLAARVAVELVLAIFRIAEHIQRLPVAPQNSDKDGTKPVT